MPTPRHGGHAPDIDIWDESAGVQGDHLKALHEALDMDTFLTAGVEHVMEITETGEIDLAFGGMEAAPDEEAYAEEHRGERAILRAVGPLKYPLGMKPRPATTSSTVKVASLDEKIAAMPGHLSLSPAQTKAYFGPGARMAFLDRLGTVSHKRHISNFNSLGSSTTFLFPEPAEDTGVDEDDRVSSAVGAFVPQRLKKDPDVSSFASAMIRTQQLGDRNHQYGATQRREVHVLSRVNTASATVRSARSGASRCRSSSSRYSLVGTIASPSQRLRQASHLALSAASQGLVDDSMQWTPGSPHSRHNGISGGMREGVGGEATVESAASPVVVTPWTVGEHGMDDGSAVGDTRAMDQSLLEPSSWIDGEIGPDGNRKSGATSGVRSSLSRSLGGFASSSGLLAENDPDSDDGEDDLLNIAMQGEMLASGTEMGVPLSPRSKFIDGCMRVGLNPRASLVLRKTLSKQLNLKHQGMGDAMARVLAESITDLPYIESVCIADNNLTDEGMAPLFKAIAKMPNLVDIDVSQNEIGPETAAALYQFLMTPGCPLLRLTLQKADVDDFECQKFIEAIRDNPGLQELDLTGNLLGQSENLNTVMPDLITGGEALADVLRSPGCSLKVLKLAWNMLRMDGAIDLCSSLSENSSLTYLDLSFNSLGRNGGCMLGDALEENKTLRTLIISSNNIDSVACFTICAGVIENEALHKLVMDENPIGAEGAKALMVLPTLVGNRVKVSAKKCNINLKDSLCWFDSKNLLRDYQIDLSDPFERAVSLVLLHLVASHHTYIFDKVEYEPPKAWSGKGPKPKGGGKRETITLESAVSMQRMQYFDESQQRVYDGLQRLIACASNVELAMQLFQEKDADGSGEIDEEEFGDLVRSLGIEMTPERQREVMAEFDVDQGGKLEIPEFLLFLKVQHREASKRLRDLTEQPVMVSRGAPPGSGKGDVNRYVPPREGILHMRVVDGFARKDIHRTLTSCDREYIDAVAKDSGDRTVMSSYGVQSFKLRLDESVALCQTILKDTTNKAKVLADVLPQMVDFNEARVLVSKVLKGNKTEVHKLRRLVGAALRPMLGLPDGYYELDFSNPMDRLCLTTLLEISKTVAKDRALLHSKYFGAGVMGDVSQHANWSCFRNEIMFGEPVVMTPALVTPMPRSGKVSFDFSSASFQQAKFDDLVLSDNRVTKMLISVHLLREEDRGAALERLDRHKKHSDACLRGDGKTLWECSTEKAAAVGQYRHEFYSRLRERTEETELYRENEEIHIHIDNDGIVNVPTLTAILHHQHHYANGDDEGQGSILKHSMVSEGHAEKSHAAISSEVLRGLDQADAAEAAEHERELEAKRAKASFVANKEAAALLAGGSTSDTSDVAAETIRNQLQQDVELKARQKAHFSSGNDEYFNKFRKLLASHEIKPQAKASKYVEVLVDMFGHTYFLCRHMELLLELFFDLGHHHTSAHFGTYRVELLTMLFGRIVDLHNFEIILRKLTPFEMACTIARIGYLCIYNPMKPEGSWELELDRPEERRICKTLCLLSVVEPGANLSEVSFKWQRDMDPMPGYELTEPWLTEEGLPKRGIWSCRYYSGEGKCLNGCRPHIGLRRAMLKLVLMNEQFICLDEQRAIPGEENTMGAKYIANETSKFINYLCYRDNA